MLLQVRVRSIQAVDVLVQLLEITYRVLDATVLILYGDGLHCRVARRYADMLVVVRRCMNEEEQHHTRKKHYRCIAIQVESETICRICGNLDIC